MTKVFHSCGKKLSDTAISDIIIHGIKGDVEDGGRSGSVKES